MPGAASKGCNSNMRRMARRLIDNTLCLFAVVLDACATISVAIPFKKDTSVLLLETGLKRLWFLCGIDFNFDHFFSRRQNLLVGRSDHGVGLLFVHYVHGL